MAQPRNDQQQNEKRTNPHYAPADFDSGVEELASNAVRFAANLGSNVLGSISDALQDAIDGIGGKAPDDFEKFHRRLQRRLKDSHESWIVGAVFSAIFAAGFGIASLVMAILYSTGVGPTPEAHQVFQILAICFAPCTFALAWLTWFTSKKAAYFGRLRKYIRTALGWTTPVEDMARRAMVDSGTVRQDLARSVADGHLPGACLDRAQATLYLDNRLYQPEPAAAPAAAPQPQTQPAPPATDLEKFQQQGKAFLEYLRSCRGRLDPAADGELATMQKTCEAIMGFIYNHPNQLPRVRRFAEYYLPTTRKLLDTAQGLGNADVENARTIRRDITGILHTLNTAYNKLYDTLLQDVSLDVCAEIDTLEAMLTQDGLAGDFASDFGKKPL